VSRRDRVIVLPHMPPSRGCLRTLHRPRAQTHCCLFSKDRGKNVGAAEVALAISVNFQLNVDPSDSVALKEERELSCKSSWKSQGSECRPELGVVEEFHQCGLKSIRRILGRTICLPRVRKFFLKISGRFERKDPRVHLANMGHCSWHFVPIPRAMMPQSMFLQSSQTLVKVQVEASLDLAKDGRGNDSAYPPRLSLGPLYLALYILTSLGILAGPATSFGSMRYASFRKFAGLENVSQAYAGCVVLPVFIMAAKALSLAALYIDSRPTGRDATHKCVPCQNKDSCNTNAFIF